MLRGFDCAENIRLRLLRVGACGLREWSFWPADATLVCASGCVGACLVGPGSSSLDTRPPPRGHWSRTALGGLFWVVSSRAGLCCRQHRRSHAR